MGREGGTHEGKGEKWREGKSFAPISNRAPPTTISRKNRWITMSKRGEKNFRRLGKVNGKRVYHGGTH